MENMEKNISEVQEKVQTRREFLKSASKVVAGAAVLGTVGSILGTSTAAIAEDTASAPAYPFPYQRLDPDETEKRGYESYYALGGCGVGVYNAIVGQLAEVVGYPYNQLPIGMLANASTGYGVGSFCGSLGGAVAAIGLVCEAADAKKITGELTSWYRTAEFPHYQPVLKSITTVADSVNCMDSVGVYMEKTGVKMGSDERKARCAGVTADVAKKAVELLNAFFNV